MYDHPVYALDRFLLAIFIKSSADLLKFQPRIVIVAVFHSSPVGRTDKTARFTSDLYELPPEQGVYQYLPVPIKWLIRLCSYCFTILDMKSVNPVFLVNEYFVCKNSMTSMADWFYTGKVRYFTFSLLQTNSVDDKLMAFFLIFPLETRVW